MKEEKDKEISWLTFDLFQDQPVKSYVFLRKGGFSQGCFSSLNVSFDVGDQEEDVQKNREAIQKILGVKKIIQGNQVHGKNVALIEKNSPEKIKGCDGLITQEKKIALMITHADCQAAFFFDPKKRAIACVHAGWRGNQKNIYKETVQKMKKNFGTDPKNLLVGISPSLGPNASEFIHYEKEWPKKFWTFQIKPKFFDLWKLAEYQLTQEGIPIHQIEVAKICTFSHPENFFSYRRENTTGRHASIFLLT